MGERRMDRPDEEIEGLLRSQPRRMPSSALWERLSVEAQQATPQRPSWSRRWVGAGALAAVAVTAALALFMADQPVPPRPTSHPREARKPGLVAARPEVMLPKETAQAVPAAEPRQRPTATRSTDRASGVRQARHQPVSRAPVIAAATDPETTGVSPGAAASGDERAESSYYLEVVRGNKRSVLSGSVVRDEERGVTRITIAYDPESRGPIGN